MSERDRSDEEAIPASDLSTRADVTQPGTGILDGVPVNDPVVESVVMEDWGRQPADRLDPDAETLQEVHTPASPA